MVQLFLIAKSDCTARAAIDCHEGDSARKCEHGLGGKVDVQVKSSSTILAFTASNAGATPAGCSDGDRGYQLPKGQYNMASMARKLTVLSGY